MIRLSALAGLILCPILMLPLGATDFSTYRGFHFGADVASTGKHVGVRLSDLTVVHSRPALIQELQWIPASAYDRGAKADPVQGARLRFYNGELFQIISTYDRGKVEGMTEADMVEAISAAYGVATRPLAEIPYQTNYGDTGRVIARWENPEYSCDLVRTGDRTSFALILSSKRLDSLAQAAIAEAVRLDALEAPQRAIDKEKQRDIETRRELDKARSANLPNFKP